MATPARLHRPRSCATPADALPDDMVAGGAAGAEGDRRPGAQRRAGGGARHGRRRRRSTPTRRRCPTTAAGRGGQPSPPTSSASARAFFTWNGGSNFTDNPEVTVEREVEPAQWKTLRRPVGRDPGDARVPAGRGRAGYLSRRPGVARGPRTSRPSSRRFDTGSRAAARRRPGPTASSSHGMHRSGGAAQPYDLSPTPSRSSRGAGSRSRTCGSSPTGRVELQGRAAHDPHGQRRRPGDRGRDRADRLPGLLRLAGPRFIETRADRLPRPGGARRRRRSSSGSASPAASGPGSTPATPPRPSSRSATAPGR